MFNQQQTKQIEKIVQETLKTNLFRYPKIPPHKHDGVDNIKIPSTSVIPNTSVIGKITFAEAKTYTLYFNSLGSTKVDFNGVVINGNGTEYALIIGNGVLSSTYYFQPNNTSSVRSGGVKYPVIGITNSSDSPRIAQCSSSLYIDQSSLGNTFPTLDQFRICRAENGSGNVISAYLNNIQNNSIDFVIETLVSGFTLKANFIIT